MILHTLEKSKIGNFGFDTLNLYSKDEIYCTGFTPTTIQVARIGELLTMVNSLSCSRDPICLYITQKEGLFWIDLRFEFLDEAIFSDSQDSEFCDALESLEKKIQDQLPRPHLRPIELQSQGLYIFN